MKTKRVGLVFEPEQTSRYSKQEGDLTALGVYLTVPLFCAFTSYKERSLGNNLHVIEYTAVSEFGDKTLTLQLVVSDHTAVIKETNKLENEGYMDVDVFFDCIRKVSTVYSIQISISSSIRMCEYYVGLKEVCDERKVALDFKPNELEAFGVLDCAGISAFLQNTSTRELEVTQIVLENVGVYISGFTKQMIVVNVDVVVKVTPFKNSILSFRVLVPKKSVLSAKVIVEELSQSIAEKIKTLETLSLLTFLEEVVSFGVVSGVAFRIEPV